DIGSLADAGAASATTAETAAAVRMTRLRRLRLMFVFSPSLSMNGPRRTADHVAGPRIFVTTQANGATPSTERAAPTGSHLSVLDRVTPVGRPARRSGSARPDPTRKPRSRRAGPDRRASPARSARGRGPNA